MNKIKILHVGLSSNLGGIEKYLVNIYRNINHNKYEMDFLVFKGKKVCFFDEISKKSKIYEITPRTKNYIQYLKDLKRFFKNSKYDYIHFHIMEFSCFERILYAQKYTNSKLIIHSHIADHKIATKKTQLLNMIGECLIRKNDTYLKTACSKAAGEYMFANFPRKEFTVLNNGINIEEFQFENEGRQKIREKFDLKDKFVIGNIGRLVPQKNHMFLLEVFYEILKLGEDAILMVIGKGPLKKSLDEKASELNIKNNIIYIENTNEVNNYMKAMDVFVFPSLFEGLGIVLIEAQASGLECFITDTLPKEVNISENITRISLTVSPREWAKKIIESRKKYIDRYKINKELRDSEFDIKNTIKILEQYYDRNLGEVKIG